MEVMSMDESETLLGGTQFGSPTEVVASFGSPSVTIVDLGIVVPTLGSSGAVPSPFKEQTPVPSAGEFIKRNTYLLTSPIYAK